MDFYINKNEIAWYRKYLEDRSLKISKRKLQFMDLGDGICEIGEEEVLANLIHFMRWIEGAKELGVNRVTIDLGEG